MLSQFAVHDELTCSRNTFPFNNEECQLSCEAANEVKYLVQGAANEDSALTTPGPATVDTELVPMAEAAPPKSKGNSAAPGRACYR